MHAGVPSFRDQRFLSINANDPWSRKHATHAHPFRHAMQLAEGQKRCDVKHLMHLATPSASQLQLAERVIFLEEKWGILSLRAANWRKGSRPLAIRGEGGGVAT